MKISHASLPLLVLTSLSLACPQSAAGAKAATIDTPTPTVMITVDPHATRSIAGESELDRKRYFAVCDPGGGIEKRARTPERYHELVDDLGISFGRQLGPIAWLAKNRNTVREDPARPGFTDTAHLQEKLSQSSRKSSPQMHKDFGSNLDVAAHGSHGAFPPFMGTYLSDVLKKEGPKPGHKSEHLPENTQAAAELSAMVFKYNYDDFTRPRYYEPVNEPHWSYLTDPKHIADWHLATMKRMHAEVPGVLVGGPCNSVGNFYGDGYRSFNGIRNFIDATAGSLDFYSFHVYDYYRWQGEDFGGTILSGLPLEGVLDLVPNYTSITYGHGTPIVISEHGGYCSGDDTLDGHQLMEKIANERFPGSGFEWLMKARSIHEFIQTNSTIANTLAFMDHPQTVKKAVPFMLVETSGWDPRYYASLYAPKDFERKATDLKASTLGNFYKLFRDVKGRRVKAECQDPDIQLRAFVDGKRLLIVAHNLARKSETLGITAPHPNTVSLRRYGRNDDLTPFLNNESGLQLSSIDIGPHETVVITAEYDSPVTESRKLEESIHYGQTITVPVKDEATITIPTPEIAGLDYAKLRIGYNRPSGSNPEMTVLLNGTALEVPVEDCASRHDQEKHGYSGTKIISIDPKLLTKSNLVTVSFPDGGTGTIGSAVIRSAK